MSSKIEDLSRLCVHTITTKPWRLEEAVKQYAAAGVKGITVWQDAVADNNFLAAGEMIRDHGLEIISYCRGGFFPDTAESKRQKAIDSNRQMLDEAAALGAPLLVLVCGAEPRQPLEVSRDQIQEGIGKVISHAKNCSVKLGIEPLHPMYADTRSAVNTLQQANDLAASFNSDVVGVAIDVYHLWWDPFLELEIRRCGALNKIFAFHICDWNVPTTDLLLDRGLMGEGCIPIPQIRGWVEEAGFRGFNEVEIFSTRFWESNQEEFLQKIIRAYRQNS